MCRNPYSDYGRRRSESTMLDDAFIHDYAWIQSSQLVSP
jgi:hypothetical protein